MQNGCHGRTECCLWIISAIVLTLYFAASVPPPRDSVRKLICAQPGGGIECLYKHCKWILCKVNICVRNMAEWPNSIQIVSGQFAFRTPTGVVSGHPSLHLSCTTCFRAAHAHHIQSDANVDNVLYYRYSNRDKCAVFLIFFFILLVISLYVV